MKTATSSTPARLQVTAKRPEVRRATLRKRRDLNLAKGLYRTTSAEGGEHATVDFGASNNLEIITRLLYEANGYEPPYDLLQPKERYDALRANKGAANER